MSNWTELVLIISVFFPISDVLFYCFGSTNGVSLNYRSIKKVISLRIISKVFSHFFYINGPRFTMHLI